MHATRKPAELLAAPRESGPDPYCGTPLGVEAAWCPNGIDIMTTDVRTVAPETKVPDCLTTMYGARIRHLPAMAAERVTLLFPYPSSY